MPGRPNFLSTRVPTRRGKVRNVKEFRDEKEPGACGKKSTGERGRTGTCMGRPPDLLGVGCLKTVVEEESTRSGSDGESDLLELEKD